MLYKKIIAVALATLAFLPSSPIGAIYRISSYGFDDITCSNDDTCDIYCDKAKHEEYIMYDCGGATQCNFHCNAEKCGALSIIKGSYATNLNITQNTNGKKCLQDATIYAPQYGNAYFHTESQAGFADMTVRSQSNTKNIIIRCSSSFIDQKQEPFCENMNVYASTAQFLQIDITNNHGFTAAVVECPINSQYNGSMIAPCIINTADGQMSNINIVATNGIPLDVYVDGCDDGCSSALTCDNGNTLESTFPFALDDSNSCWRTLNPTNVPTIYPTKTPTLSPTRNPTLTPTKYPTLSPTHQPTNNPTFNPINTPIMEPTIAPTSIPTINPTNNPAIYKPSSIHPTEYPSISPTISTSAITLKPSVFIPTLNPNPSPFDSQHVEILHTTQDTHYLTESDSNDNHKNEAQKGSINTFMSDFFTHTGNWAALILFCVCIILCFLLVKKQKRDNWTQVISEYVAEARARSATNHYPITANACNEDMHSMAQISQNRRQYVVEMERRDSSSRSSSTSEDLYSTPPKTQGGALDHKVVFQSQTELKQPDDLQSLASMVTAVTNFTNITNQSITHAAKARQQKYALDMVEIESDISYNAEPAFEANVCEPLEEMHDEEKECGSMANLLKRHSHNLWHLPSIDIGVNEVTVSEKEDLEESSYDEQFQGEEDHDDDNSVSTENSDRNVVDGNTPFGPN